MAVIIFRSQVWHVYGYSVMIQSIPIVPGAPKLLFAPVIGIWKDCQENVIKHNRIKWLRHYWLRQLDNIILQSIL